jgi:hypothetical protein
LKPASEAGIDAQQARPLKVDAPLICTSESSPLLVQSQNLFRVKAVQERLLVDTDLTG